MSKFSSNDKFGTLNFILYNRTQKLKIEYRLKILTHFDYRERRFFTSLPVGVWNKG